MSRKYELTDEKKRKIKDMIKNINNNFFKNSKLKLCTIGTFSLILSTSLTGCAFTNHIQNYIQHQDSNYNATENTTDLSEDKEQAIITLEYAGLESIPERDVITFSNPGTAEILGIAATDKEKKELSLPPGRYMITSNYLKEKYFEIENPNEKWTLKADYHNNTLKITEKNNNTTENTTDSLEDKERATITLEYEGLESIPERDIITFTNLDARQISGIAATNAEGRELTLKPGRYVITSNYLEEEYFEIENSNEKWTLEADYNSNTLKITENNK